MRLRVNRWDASPFIVFRPTIFHGLLLFVFGGVSLESRWWFLNLINIEKPSNSNRNLRDFRGRKDVSFPFFLPAAMGNLASCNLQTFSDLEPGRTHPCKHTKQSKKPGVQLKINRCGKAGFFSTVLPDIVASLFGTAGFPHGIGTSTILVWRDPILAFQANSILSFLAKFFDHPSLRANMAKNQRKKNPYDG